MHEPNPEVRPTGDEASEYVEDPTDGPPAPTSPDPTGEGGFERSDATED